MDLESRKQELSAQEHVFTFWDELSHIDKTKLLDQLDMIDFQEVETLFAKHAEHSMPSFSPTKIYTRDDFSSKTYEIGLAAIKAGKLGIFIVAGGDGSRLGFDGPKGLFSATAVKHKTLFQLFCERLLHIKKLWGKQPQLYIMTSDNNHEQTVRFFKENNNFGVEPPVVFKQKMLPVVDHDGKVIMSDTHSLVFAPSGTGGIYDALNKRGVIRHMEERGVEYLHYVQIDNPMAFLADPLFIGAHIETRSEFSTKVIEKAYPEEKVGLVVESKGKAMMCEYIHLSEEQAYQRDDDGKLSYRAANTGIHMISRDFIKRIDEEHSLPFFLANKKVVCIDERGDHVTPLEPNAYKFESFVFDAMPNATATLTLEVDRDVEFAPIKNASGKDSPTSAIEQMTRVYKNWLRAIDVPDDILDEVDEVEISPLLASNKDEFVKKTKNYLPAIIRDLKKKKLVYID